MTITLPPSLVEGLELRHAQLLADGFDFTMEAIAIAAISQYLTNSETYTRARREAMTDSERAAEAKESEIHAPFYPASHFAGHRQ